MIKIDKIFELYSKFSFRGLIALLVLLGDFLFIFTFFFKEIPPPNKDAIMLLGGVMIGLSPQVISWYFGSSKDKADKDKVDAINSAPPAP